MISEVFCRFALMHLPGKITYKEIDEMIATVDKTQYGKISYSEFRVIPLTSLKECHDTTYKQKALTKPSQNFIKYPLLSLMPIGYLEYHCFNLIYQVITFHLLFKSKIENLDLANSTL